MAQDLGFWLDKRRRLIHARLPWPAAHDESTAFLILIASSLSAVFMVDAAIEHFDQPAAVWLLVAVLWLPLLAAENMPTGSGSGAVAKSDLPDRRAGAAAHAGLARGLPGRYLHAFSLVGQAGFILRVPGAFTFLILTAVSRFAVLHLNPRDAGSAISADASWLVGATFVVLAIAAMRHALDQRRQVSNLGAGLHVTLSMGLAAIDGEARLEQLISAADGRLLEAKRLGKNRLVSAG